MRALVTLCLLSVLVAACDSGTVDPIDPDSEPVTTEPTSVIVPLAVGNEWKYSVVRTLIAPDGVTVAGVDTLTTPSTIRVIGTEEVNGETWYVVARTGEFNAFLYTRLTNRADGLYGRGENPESYAFKIAAYPAPVGMQFGTSTWTGGIDDDQYVTTDTDVTLKVTDLQAFVGEDEYEGYLFTAVPRRFRVGTEQYEIEPFARPFHQLLIPDVGYARFENAYYSVVPPGMMRQGAIFTSTLQSFTLAPQPS